LRSAQEQPEIFGWFLVAPEAKRVQIHVRLPDNSQRAMKKIIFALLTCWMTGQLPAADAQ
jgi:hypothetical protein